ncbi:hypothetical protein BPAE_0435g00090 [Botrytis paeoniae]|uniref:Uncharacterized protein n=1 Tax=Botrytis paeoniae TaxID=278948 RepID=A0A4Z1EYI4_9HELO|nr:hypothetical protein BPAE_0435g00090 [Botrytis paeoniae]
MKDETKNAGKTARTVLSLRRAFSTYVRIPPKLVGKVLTFVDVTQFQRHSLAYVAVESNKIQILVFMLTTFEPTTFDTDHENRPRLIGSTDLNCGSPSFVGEYQIELD